MVMPSRIGVKPFNQRRSCRRSWRKLYLDLVAGHGRSSDAERNAPCAEVRTRPSSVWTVALTVVIRRPRRDHSRR